MVFLCSLVFKSVCLLDWARCCSSFVVFGFVLFVSAFCFFVFVSFCFL